MNKDQENLFNDWWEEQKKKCASDSQEVVKFWAKIAWIALTPEIRRLQTECVQKREIISQQNELLDMYSDKIQSLEAQLEEWRKKAALYRANEQLKAQLLNDRAARIVELEEKLRRTGHLEYLKAPK